LTAPYNCNKSRSVFPKVLKAMLLFQESNGSSHKSDKSVTEGNPSESMTILITFSHRSTGMVVPGGRTCMLE
jgi:hypothetical protein